MCSTLSTSRRAGTRARTGTSIRELLQGRTQVAERLASALDGYETAKAAVATAEQAVADKAAEARAVYQEEIDVGWTATELTSAGSNRVALTAWAEARPSRP